MPLPCPTPVANSNHAWMGSEPDPEALLIRQAEGDPSASEAPRYAITIGGLTGGRRVLSDDVTMLETIAVAVALPLLSSEASRSTMRPTPTAHNRAVRRVRGLASPGGSVRLS